MSMPTQPPEPIPALGTELFSICESIKQRIVQLAGEIGPCLVPEEAVPLRDGSKVEEAPVHSQVTETVQNLRTELISIEGAIELLSNRVRWK